MKSSNAETQSRRENDSKLLRLLTYCCGALPAIALLGFYQWRSFGNPFYPPQYHMPALNPYAETGFHGYVGIQPHLLWALLFDYRYGLFLSCPILLLSFVLFRIRHNNIPKLEQWFLFVFFLAMWIFFSGVNYANLQFNTGIRYLVVILPFLFIAAAIVMMALPRTLAISFGVLTVIQAWCLAMYRDVERGAGIAEPLIRIFREGPKLPALTTLSRMEAFKDLPYLEVLIGVFIVVASLLYFIWKSPGGAKARESL